MCFRTWHPRRGPVRALLKDERSAQMVWLTGARAALWESIESGITLARLRRQARALHAANDLNGFVSQLLESRAAHDPADRRGDQCDPDATASQPGEPTHELEVRTWMAAQGYAFEASWNRSQADASMREAMDRLDFLRESGVFQIRFAHDASLSRNPLDTHIRAAARAQGFCCVTESGQ